MGIAASKRSVDITHSKSPKEGKTEHKPVEMIEAKEKDTSLIETPEKKEKEPQPNGDTTKEESPQTPETNDVKREETPEKTEEGETEGEKDITTESKSESEKKKKDKKAELKEKKKREKEKKKKEKEQKKKEKKEKDEKEKKEKEEKAKKDKEEKEKKAKEEQEKETTEEKPEEPTSAEESKPTDPTESTVAETPVKEENKEEKEDKSATKPQKSEEKKKKKHSFRSLSFLRKKEKAKDDRTKNGDVEHKDEEAKSEDKAEQSAEKENDAQETKEQEQAALASPEKSNDEESKTPEEIKTPVEEDNEPFVQDENKPPVEEIKAPVEEACLAPTEEIEDLTSTDDAVKDDAEVKGETKAEEKEETPAEETNKDATRESPGTQMSKSPPDVVNDAVHRGLAVASDYSDETSSTQDTSDEVDESGDDGEGPITPPITEITHRQKITPVEVVAADGSCWKEEILPSGTLLSDASGEMELGRGVTPTEDDAISPLETDAAEPVVELTVAIPFEAPTRGANEAISAEASDEAPQEGTGRNLKGTTGEMNPMEEDKQGEDAASVVGDSESAAKGLYEEAVVPQQLASSLDDGQSVKNRSTCELTNEEDEEVVTDERVPVEPGPGEQDDHSYALSPHTGSPAKMIWQEKMMLDELPVKEIHVDDTAVQATVAVETESTGVQTSMENIFSFFSRPRKVEQDKSWCTRSVESLETVHATAKRSSLKLESLRREIHKDNDLSTSAGSHQPRAAEQRGETVIGTSVLVKPDDESSAESLWLLLRKDSSSSCNSSVNESDKVDAGLNGAALETSQTEEMSLRKDEIQAKPEPSTKRLSQSMEAFRKTMEAAFFARGVSDSAMKATSLDSLAFLCRTQPSHAVDPVLLRRSLECLRAAYPDRFAPDPIDLVEKDAQETENEDSSSFTESNESLGEIIRRTAETSGKRTLQIYRVPMQEWEIRRSILKSDISEEEHLSYSGSDDTLIVTSKERSTPDDEALPSPRGGLPPLPDDISASSQEPVVEETSEVIDLVAPESEEDIPMTTREADSEKDVDIILGDISTADAALHEDSEKLRTESENKDQSGGPAEEETGEKKMKTESSTASTPDESSVFALGTSAAVEEQEMGATLETPPQENVLVLLENKDEAEVRDLKSKQTLVCATSSSEEVGKDVPISEGTSPEEKDLEPVETTEEVPSEGVVQQVLSEEMETTEVPAAIDSTTAALQATTELPRCSLYEDEYQSPVSPISCRLCREHAGEHSPRHHLECAIPSSSVTPDGFSASPTSAWNSSSERDGIFSPREDLVAGVNDAFQSLLALVSQLAMEDAVPVEMMSSALDRIQRDLQVKRATGTSYANAEKVSELHEDDAEEEESEVTDSEDSVSEMQEDTKESAKHVDDKICSDESDEPEKALLRRAEEPESQSEEMAEGVEEAADLRKDDEPESNQRAVVVDKCSETGTLSISSEVIQEAGEKQESFAAIAKSARQAEAETQKILNEADFVENDESRDRPTLERNDSEAAITTEAAEEKALASSEMVIDNDEDKQEKEKVESAYETSGPVEVDMSQNDSLVVVNLVDGETEKPLEPIRQGTSPESITFAVGSDEITEARVSCDRLVASVVEGEEPSIPDIVPDARSNKEESPTSGESVEQERENDVTEEIQEEGEITSEAPEVESDGKESNVEHEEIEESVPTRILGEFDITPMAPEVDTTAEVPGHSDEESLPRDIPTSEEERGLFDTSSGQDTDREESPESAEILSALLSRDQTPMVMMQDDEERQDVSPGQLQQDPEAAFAALIEVVKLQLASLQVVPDEEAIARQIDNLTAAIRAGTRAASGESSYHSTVLESASLLPSIHEISEETENEEEPEAVVNQVTKSVTETTHRLEEVPDKECSAGTVIEESKKEVEAGGVVKQQVEGAAATTNEAHDEEMTKTTMKMSEEAENGKEQDPEVHHWVVGTAEATSGIHAAVADEQVSTKMTIASEATSPSLLTAEQASTAEEAVDAGDNREGANQSSSFIPDMKADKIDASAVAVRDNQDARSPVSKERVVSGSEEKTGNEGDGSSTEKQETEVPDMGDSEMLAETEMKETDEFAKIREETTERTIPEKEIMPQITETQITETKGNSPEAESRNDYGRSDSDVGLTATTSDGAVVEVALLDGASAVEVEEKSVTPMITVKMAESSADEERSTDVDIKAADDTNGTTTDDNAGNIMISHENNVLQEDVVMFLDRVVVPELEGFVVGDFKGDFLPQLAPPEKPRESSDNTVSAPPVEQEEVVVDIPSQENSDRKSLESSKNQVLDEREEETIPETSDIAGIPNQKEASKRLPSAETIHDAETEGIREETIHDAETEGIREETIHDAETEGIREETISVANIAKVLSETNTSENVEQLSEEVNEFRADVPRADSAKDFVTAVAKTEPAIDVEKSSLTADEVAKSVPEETAPYPFKVENVLSNEVASKEPVKRSVEQEELVSETQSVKGVEVQTGKSLLPSDEIPSKEQEPESKPFTEPKATPFSAEKVEKEGVIPDEAKKSRNTAPRVSELIEAIERDSSIPSEVRPSLSRPKRSSSLRSRLPIPQRKSPSSTISREKMASLLSGINQQLSAALEETSTSSTTTRPRSPSASPALRRRERIAPGRTRPVTASRGSSFRSSFRETTSVRESSSSTVPREADGKRRRSTGAAAIFSGGSQSRGTRDNPNTHRGTGQRGKSP